MSFGVLNIARLLPEFLATYQEVSVDLHLSDAMVELVGDGFDAAIRIAVLGDSSLVARRLCETEASRPARATPLHRLQLHHDA
jgi:DNA-binding transcriptional LysR family regulator